jgi:hypothetical protein
MCNADDVYFLPADVLARRGVPEELTRWLAIGEEIRDWANAPSTRAVFPYGPALELIEPSGRTLEFLWPFRSVLSARAVFSGGTYRDAGRPWWEWHQVTKDRYRTPRSIVFAFVATHNHFVLDRGGKVFNRSAPIIKLKDGATEDDYLALLAYLNSSIACFWMKQVMMDKGATSDRGVLQADPEKFRFEFDGTKMATVPVPAQLATYRGGLILGYARRLANAGSELATFSFEAVIAGSSPGTTAAQLQARVQERDAMRGKMVGWQEELDWLVYELFGLISPNGACTAASSPDSVPARDTDDRAYRRPEAHPVRAKAIASNPELALLERPEFKRRWFRSAGAFDAENVTDAMRAEGAARNVLSAGLEKALSGAEPMSCSSLLATAVCTPSCLAAAEALRRDMDKRLVGEELASDSIPFLAAHRYTDAGLEKRRQWERVWNLQRAEDRGETVPSFDPPPKYDQKDYRDATFWRLRGKLDVPKERFISYPGCESDEDVEPVYGWAGWDHLQQAIALATLYMKRKQGEAWGKERLIPMLAGLDELLPWIWQWHPEPTPESGGMKPGQYIADFMSAQCQELGITIEDLRGWRPSALRAPKRVVSESAESVRPNLTAHEETLLIVVALALARPSPRVVLARAFALLYQPALLKRLIPAHLKGRAARWSRQVKRRSPAPGAFRLALDGLVARGTLVEGPQSAIRLASGAQGTTLQRWWRDEAELALAAADAMTDETLETLASNVPSADRQEIGASA